MSLAPSSYPSLYSSLSLPRNQQTKPNTSLITHPSFISAQSLFLSSNSASFCNPHVAKRRNFREKSIPSANSILFPLCCVFSSLAGKGEDTGELTEKEIIRAERNSRSISSRLTEIQMQNYLRKKELKAQREKDLCEGLQFSKNGKYEEALERFESVLGSKPTPDEASVASYNVACCYSKLNQVQAGLSALEEALKSGYEDFKISPCSVVLSAENQSRSRS